MKKQTTKYFLLFFLTWAVGASAQKCNSPKVQLLSGERDCSTLLEQLILLDTLYNWKDQQLEQKDFQVGEFNQIRQMVEKALNFSTSFDNSICVAVAAFEPKTDSPLHYMEIYQIDFHQKSGCKKLLDAIEKYQVDHIDWPDATQSVHFWAYENTILMCLDSSDEPDKQYLLSVADYLRHIPYSVCREQK